MIDKTLQRSEEAQPPDRAAYRQSYRDSGRPVPTRCAVCHCEIVHPPTSAWQHAKMVNGHAQIQFTCVARYCIETVRRGTTVDVQ